jgi:4-hydroxy-tetrahydrodipicolinate synthase
MIRNEKDRDLLRRLPGLTVAMATPLDESGELDVDALCRLTDHLIAEGAASIFALGWMGEQPALTDSIRKDVMTEVVRRVDGRVPVIAGVSEQSLPRALAEAEHAHEAGVDIVLATAPYSYQLPLNVIIDYFTDFATASPLPLILYNNSEAHTPLPPDAVQSISQVPGMIGIKDYSDFLQLQRLLAKVNRDEDFIVLAAEEFILGPALFLGANFSMLGGPGNLVPGWAVRMHQHANAGEWNDVARLHMKLVDFCDTLYPLADSAYSTVKSALATLGFGSGRCVPPMPSMDAAGDERVREVLRRFEVI